MRHIARLRLLSAGLLLALAIVVGASVLAVSPPSNSAGRRWSSTSTLTAVGSLGVVASVPVSPRGRRW